MHYETRNEDHMDEILLKIHMGLGKKMRENGWQKKKKMCFAMVPTLKTFE